ncbi:VWA domain-containing protein [Algisphaera agarilytica]|uniref:Mg-chelatase subunit ChlD n=1 Tax=Algisphaera agarilytica TaxID=1385975 RepID=A0A7X0H4B6_9BACT|nr:VWA domain-containing protein [Algisphaera agarilytica]MBB6428833.1 Mg-chelatase subunit ChlD [Algisphaera agarilytica]
MILAEPHWLLLVVPLGLAWWLLRPGGWWLRGLRVLIYGLIVLAMCEPRLVLPERAGTVVVVADRSASMPGNAADQQLEAIALLHAAMSPEDRLAVVGFGEAVALEQEPAVERVEGFEQAVGGDASDLSGALRRALALIPGDGAGRVLVLSDGRFTGRDPGAEAARAAARGVPIDYRDLSRPATRDLAVTHVDTPATVQPGESFMITGWVQSPSAQSVSFELMRGNTRIASGQRDLPAGLSRLTFRDRAQTPGSMDYRLRLTHADPAALDPVPENNTGRFIVGVEGNKPLLVVTRSPGQGLANLLRAGGLDVVSAQPEQLQGTLQELSNYAGIVLENVPATDLPANTLDQLAPLIEESGVGLAMTGGQQSFGPGGYFQSAIDPLLPVSMELRQEHRKLSLAIVIALDRSGSMSMTVPDGRTKMDLANLGSAQVLELLGPMDELGVIAVDSAPHTIVNLGPVTDKATLKKKILSIDSMGGGIYVYEALAASAGMLASATPTTRHIILFSDAQDSEAPGAYQTLLEKARRANITVSVIGLGSDRDVDAGLLKDIAKRGGGRAFFTEDPKKLPQLFAQDTFVVARSSFIDETTPVRSTGALTAMTGRSFTDPPPVGGYNLNYLKPDAQLALATTDQNTAPLVASWQAGLGRVAVYTGEADGKFTGPIADWPQLGDLLTSLARWVAARDRRLPDTLLVRQRIDGGRLVVELLLDPERPEQGLPGEPRVSVLSGRPGTAPTSRELSMQYAAPDKLVAEFNLPGADVALATVDLGALGSVTLPPTRLLYSPEYRPNTRDGRTTLQLLADITQGQARAELGSIWDDLVPIERFATIAHWLWLAVVVLLLLEVLERRTSWVSQLSIAVYGRRRQAKAAPSPSEAPAKTDKDTVATSRRSKRRRKPAPIPDASPAKSSAPAPQAAPAETPKSKPQPTPDPDQDMLSALNQAKRKADRRTGR